MLTIDPHDHELLDAFSWKPNRYVPHHPTTKQLALLCLPHKEAFFGGAAGGGKSDALLMGALQYVHVENFSAIIFRKSLTDLELSDGLIPRSHQWLDDTDADWNGSLHRWTFPSRATLQFGYLARELDRFRYRSSAYQYIAFDELTDFFKDDYEFLFTRLRRPLTMKVPLKMRSASNPGGPGHRWVKRHFRIRPAPDGTGRFVGQNPDRPYIPSFLSDNPYLDQAAYEDSLEHVDEITKSQYLHGDWAASFKGRFRRGWCQRRYTVQGNMVNLEKMASYNISSCYLFQIVDPAASARHGPSDDNYKRKMPSWTVIATFLAIDGNLIWWDNIRIREEIPQVLRAVKLAAKTHRPDFIGIESSGLGIGVYQMLEMDGLPVRPLLPRSSDKVVRATDASHRMKRGKVWLPEDAPWLEDLEDELFTWTGHPDEQDDQVDVLAYASMMVTEMGYEDRISDDSPSVMPGPLG